MRRGVWVLALLGMVAWAPCESAEPVDPAKVLAGSIAREVGSRLEQIAAVAESAAREVPLGSSDAQAVQSFLADRALYVPHLQVLMVLDAEGVVRHVGPGYRFLAGLDLSQREWVKAGLASRTPVLSSAFLSIEGFHTVAFMAPVVREGKRKGVFCVVVRAGALLGQWVEIERKAAAFDVWVMETGGRLLYDLDSEEMGRNLIEDPLYAPHAGLVELARKVAGLRQGGAAFELTPVGGKPLPLVAGWESVSVLGTSWRIVAVRAADETRSPLRTLASLGIPSATDALRLLAVDPAFVEAASQNLWRTVHTAMARHYERYPCYAIQWVTPSGLVRDGYPPGNALVGYQLNPFEHTSDAPLLERVQARERGIFRTPLAEGLMGVVQIEPVFFGTELLGFIYSVRVDQS